MRPSAINADVLFEAFRSYSLRWQWIAGIGASERRFDEIVVRSARSGADLVGYLNYIHPYRLQVLGEREIAYLTNATSQDCLRRIARIVTLEPPVLIVADAQTPPDALLQMCERAQIPLFATEERAAQLQSALKSMSVPDFVRLCAKSAGDELDEAIFDHFSEEDFSRALLQMLTAAAEPEEVEEKPPAAESTPDPDAGKHAFEVFCDCVELDEQLVAYLIDILKRGDKAAFYKLSQVTTQLDLDPREFLYWLAHREDYGTDDERACAAIMDACFARLYEEKQGELLGALLSGDQKTFELFRTEAPELRHLPAATYEWYSKNYLDRDYPLRFILMCNGVEFPDTPEEDK